MKYITNLFILSMLSFCNSFRFMPFKGIIDNFKDKYINFKRKKILSIYDPNILDKLRKFSDHKYTIIDRKNDVIFNNYTTFLNEYKYLENKQTISISPGGIQGFYLIGIIDFLKFNYNLDSFLFTGASAGAWSCLLMSYKGNIQSIINLILKEIKSFKVNSLFEMQLYLKQLILRTYTIDDFDFTKTFIGVTVLKNLDFSTNLFFNFENLEDAIDCCIASSHIPFLTGGLVNKYNNAISFDGGFSNSPYLDINSTILNVNPNMWNKRTSDILNLEDILNNVAETDYYELYLNGYIDSQVNKHDLDKIFKPKN